MIDGETLINRLEELIEYLREQRSNVSFGSDTENTLYEFQFCVSIAIELLKEQEEREKTICKGICDLISGPCCTDTEADKDYVCHEIRKIFIRT